MHIEAQEWETSRRKAADTSHIWLFEPRESESSTDLLLLIMTLLAMIQGTAKRPNGGLLTLRLVIGVFYVRRRCKGQTLTVAKWVQEMKQPSSRVYQPTSRNFQPGNIRWLLSENSILGSL
jgi:hypothetical protein